MKKFQCFYGNVPKFGMFSNKEKLVLRAEIHKMLDIIANIEDPGQTASLKKSEMGQCCLYRPIWQATSVHNFSRSTIYTKMLDLSRILIFDRMFLMVGASFNPF